MALLPLSNEWSKHGKAGFCLKSSINFHIFNLLGKSRPIVGSSSISISGSWIIPLIMSTARLIPPESWPIGRSTCFSSPKRPIGVVIGLLLLLLITHATDQQSEGFALM